nr:MAG TPA: helix-turn-helix domain-containing protein [Caudoviricetes sp.]
MGVKMKAVLLSIRPKWCKKIANLQKTVEIRKTAPNLEVPFKCYIYCTKAPKKLITIFRDGEESYDGEIYHGKTKFITWDGIGVPDDIDSAMQMVIGEFVCDKIDKLVHVGTMMDINILTLDGWYKPADALLQAACLTEETAKKYLQGRNGYGWHISELKLYDKPVKLKDFWAIQPCKHRGDCCTCRRWDAEKLICRGEAFGIERPPQSWYYVEVYG